MTYGMMTKTDYETMDRILDAVCRRVRGPVVRVLEIGVNRGDTARGIKARIEELGKAVDYVGIEAEMRAFAAPFDSATMIYDDSTNAHVCDIGPFDFILVDGCHCKAHVITDFFLYKNRLSKGGIIAFHDTSPEIAPMQDYQGHGPRVHEFCICVREALAMLPMSKMDFLLVEDAWDPAGIIGGIMAYVKLDN